VERLRSSRCPGMGAGFGMAGGASSCPSSGKGRHGSELGEPPQVLSSGSQQELVACAARSPQSQAGEPQDPFEVGKQHLDLLPVVTGALKRWCLRQSPGDVTRVFIHIEASFRQALAVARDQSARLWELRAATRCAASRRPRHRQAHRGAHRENRLRGEGIPLRETIPSSPRAHGSRNSAAGSGTHYEGRWRSSSSQGFETSAALVEGQRSRSAECGC
jgi:hypothetical protein